MGRRKVSSTKGGFGKGGKAGKSVSKHLYKILIYVLKYIPFILALMETVFVVLNYYELPHYYLNVFGGFSICFIITLYL